VSVQAHAPLCPRCRQNDRVEKASAIYVEGLASARRLKNAGAEGAPRRLTRIAPDAVRELSKRLSPPASPTRIQVRPIHPDLVVAAFTLILPFFVSGIASRQQGMLVPILVFLALVYGLYFLTRGRILERFARQEAERQAEANRYKKAIDAWMQLYYCDKDGILFFPGSLKSAPVDEANRLLFEDRESR
jgi:hypothetical protein